MKIEDGNNHAGRWLGRALKYSTVIAIMYCLAFGLSGSLHGIQSVTQKNLDRLDWQPTQAIPGAQYVGSEVCAQCHSQEAAEWETSAMAHGLQLPVRSSVLQLNPRLTFSNGPYHYTIERNDDRVSYTVANGNDSISVPVAWAFGYGLGQVGQTYLLSYKGSYYESRVTFFNGTAGLGITLGHPTHTPISLQDGIGREVKPGELRACFGCHSTGAVSGGKLQIDQLVPGISCEGCHGPGAAHVAAIRAGKSQQSLIFNPAKLDPGNLVKFCGACHRTAAHVKEIHAKGVITVRFQPYRLAESACFNPRDGRISCLACHNPHQNPQPSSTFYDSKCQACHGDKELSSPGERTAVPCKVARSRCVTCHMPKYLIAGSHFRFTDHKIRIVRLGDEVE